MACFWTIFKRKSLNLSIEININDSYIYKKKNQGFVKPDLTIKINCFE